MDALDQYLTSIGSRLERLVGPSDLHELGAMFPSLRGLGEGPATAPGPDDRLRAYRAVRSLGEVLAKMQPLALVLDDLHWADLGSLELIGHLLRNPPSGPVLVAAAARSGQLDARLAAVLESADPGRSAKRVELEPLSRSDAEPLIAGVPDADRLFEESGGNPFYLGQLVRGLSTGTKGAGEGGQREAVPARVALAIDRELAALSVSGRELAQAAAIAGDPFELDVAVAAAALDEATALTALDELAGVGLVRQGAAPREFRFRHPLVRAAVYDGVAPGTRLRVHARCAELLAARGAPPSVRAHHVEHAARSGDLAAVELLAEAAAETGSRAPASAIRWLRHALQLLPADADSASRLELLLPVPGLLTSIGELAAARDAAVEALRLVPAEASALRVDLTAACASLEQATGRQADAHRRLGRARDEMGEGGGPAAVGLLVATTMAYGYSRDYAQMREWGQRAGTAGRRVDPPALRAAALGVSALAHAFSGHIEEALRWRAEAADAVDALDDDQLAERLDAIGFLAAAELYLDLYPETVAHAGRGVEIGRHSGRLGLVPTLVPSLGTATWVVGRVRESAAMLEDAVEAARIGRVDQALAWRLFNLALAQELRGDVDDAVSTGREALALANRIDDSVIGSWAGMVLGAALLEQGDPEQGRAVMLETCGEDAKAIPGGWRLFALEKLVRCLLPTDLQAAAEVAGRAAHHAAAIDLPMAQAWSLRANAQVALATGDGATAARLAQESASWADRASARIDAARSLAIAGQGLAQDGRIPEACEQLHRAAADFDACGARRLRDATERELGRHGGRPRRQTRRGAADGDGVATLTGRELEVARLVAERLTNGEIAAELFLSVKTVETHLRNIFRKLDVRSRVDVARAVERHGTDDRRS